MPIAAEHTPTRIAQHDARTLAIDWADGTRSLYDVRALRLACACAECVDEWSGEARLAAANVPQDVAPTGIHSVGRYAIQIDWSDGHATGIYPFARLRRLVEARPLEVRPTGAPRAPMTPSAAAAAAAVAKGGPEAAPVTPRLAATVLLVRDAEAGLEVFMLERHQKSDFAEGALVFPGGKTETADGDPALATGVRGASALDPTDRLLRAAAIRETFEECGVLLARPHGRDALVDADRRAAIARRWREPLRLDTATLPEVVAAEDLELAFELLVPFAHWITPEFMPMRFDTHFYVVAAPPGQLADHDGAESVDSLWTTVPEAIELELAGRRTIIFPTLENLKKLGRSRTVADALARARRTPIVTVTPRVEIDGEGRRFMVLPAESGYDTLRAPLESLAGSVPRPETPR
ncbi:MAG: gamma-butyrobetaine hydroxylase-like domain-containing protein [Myxococcota bacterium]